MRCCSVRYTSTRSCVRERPRSTEITHRRRQDQGSQPCSRPDGWHWATQRTHSSRGAASRSGLARAANRQRTAEQRTAHSEKLDGRWRDRDSASSRVGGLTCALRASVTARMSSTPVIIALICMIKLANCTRFSSAQPARAQRTVQNELTRNESARRRANPECTAAKASRSELATDPRAHGAHRATATRRASGHSRTRGTHRGCAPEPISRKMVMIGVLPLVDSSRKSRVPAP